MSYDLNPDDVLDGRFTVVKLINQSGMGSIFEATDGLTKSRVAIKVPLMQFESDPAFFARFKREEEIGLLLEHRSILKFFSVETKSRPYIVTEFVVGKSLTERMRSAPLLAPEAIGLVLRICDALAYMHSKGVVHRDLKPDNILLCDDGSIRVIDFGLASATAKRITMLGFSNSMGTPDYMAPEQVKGKRGDARTDIYSLAAMLYEMLTGALPFKGENAHAMMTARIMGDPIAPRQFKPELSLAVEEILLHALERQPEDRYQTIDEFKAELEQPERVTVTGRAQRLRAGHSGPLWLQRYRAPLLMLGVPIVLLVLFLIFGRR